MMDSRNIDQDQNEAAAKPAGHDSSSKKAYTSPKLTHYGQMNQLTKLGGGDGENDGELPYGSPS
jgi:hypothetical protein